MAASGSGETGATLAPGAADSAADAAATTESRSVVFSGIHGRVTRAVVTGASSGIGLALVHRLVENGATVCAVGRSEAKMREAVGAEALASGRVHVIEADVGTVAGATAAGRRAVELLEGRIDLLVNNAGAGRTGITLGSITEEEFDWHIDVNVKSVLFTTQACLPGLEAAEGAVVNISSVAGHRAMKALATYSIAKCVHRPSRRRVVSIPPLRPSHHVPRITPSHVLSLSFCRSPRAAVDHMTRALAIELASKRVRVNSVAPATVETAFARTAGASEEAAAKYYTDSAALHPIGRVGRPDDISDLVFFLAGATWITGSVFIADGGRLLTVPMAPLN